MMVLEIDKRRGIGTIEDRLYLEIVYGIASDNN